MIKYAPVVVFLYQNNFIHLYSLEDKKKQHCNSRSAAT
jgi:hypothetical protein